MQKSSRRIVATLKSISRRFSRLKFYSAKDVIVFSFTAVTAFPDGWQNRNHHQIVIDKSGCFLNLGERDPIPVTLTDAYALEDLFRYGETKFVSGLTISLRN